MVSWIILLYVILLAAAILLMHLCAILTIDIQVNKGYKARYWVGFVFGPLAWLYCFVLPDLKNRKFMMEISENLKQNK